MGSLDNENYADDHGDNVDDGDDDDPDDCDGAGNATDGMALMITVKDGAEGVGDHWE